MSEAIDALKRLREVRALQAVAIADLVDRARSEGETWEVIGAALGVTRQAAQQMYGRVRVIEGDK